MTTVQGTVGMDYQGNVSNSWMVETGGYYASKIHEYLVNDGIPSLGAATILQNAAKVLRFCPNPSTNEDKALTGIVIGKVQSGKTSSFISLAALAFDNGYSHVVVFGGTKNVLVSQNSERINEYFKACPDVIVLNTTEHKSQLNSDTILQFVKHGKKVIIVALKTSKQIGLIKNEVFCDPELADKPTLIIDDEGDEASLNTLVFKGKKSATYRAIEGLKATLRRHCFVSVTATPQANLLISSVDILSPDFGVLVAPGKGYCGLDVFHTPKSQYIRVIPEHESSLLDEGVPASFYEALATFFVACGIFKYRGIQPGSKLSMLIHPSQLKVDHEIAFQKTKKIIGSWNSLAKNKKDIAYGSLKNKLLSAYNKYKTETIPDVPAFELIEDYVLEAISFYGLHKVNGDSIPNGIDKVYDFNIYVGGAMLGRGLTLKGLAITYIIRTAKGTSTADTVTQRARWFGYKAKYLDLCRVYAVNKIVGEFKDIREHEEDIWETIRDANLQGTNFKDISRIFLLSDSLKPTRTNVAHVDSYKFKPWNYQRLFQSNASYTASNQAILEKFRSKYKDHETQLHFGGDRAGSYAVISGLRLSMIKEEITDNFLFPNGSSFNGSVVAKLVNLLQKKELDPLVDVIWMRDGKTSEHDIDNDGRIPNYFVGRRPEDYSKPAVYEGDQEQFKSRDKVQLQIHLIKNRETGFASPVLALYLPTSCIEKLTNLVIRS